MFIGMSCVCWNLCMGALTLALRCGVGREEVSGEVPVLSELLNIRPNDDKNHTPLLPLLWSMVVLLPMTRALDVLCSLLSVPFNL